MGKPLGITITHPPYLTLRKERLPQADISETSLPGASSVYANSVTKFWVLEAAIHHSRVACWGDVPYFDSHTMLVHKAV